MGFWPGRVGERVCDMEVEPLARAVGQDGILRGGCLPPPSRANVPVGRLPIGRSLASCPTPGPSALRARTPGLRPLCQAIAPAATSMSHTLGEPLPCFPFRDPFVRAGFEKVEGEGSAVEHPVVEAAEIELGAQFPLGAVAQFAELELTNLVA